MGEMRVKARTIIGKMIVSEESGSRFGVVNNVDFITESGELLNLVVESPTKRLLDLNLKTNERGNVLIPFSAIKSIGDFVIISENELI